MASIEIPLKANPGEVLEIMFDELPGDESEIISILKEEEAHLDLWFRFAVIFSFFLIFSYFLFYFC